MNELEFYTHRFHAMGTDCSVHLYAPDAASGASAAMAAVAEVQRIECRYSRYRDDSDLSAINRLARAGGAMDVDAETAGLLNYAFAGYRRSGGLFDITSGLLRQAWDFRSGRLPERSALDALLPRVGLNKVEWDGARLSFPVAGMELDFGGIGKEYAADRAAVACQAAGVEHGLIDLGGDMRVIGPHPDGHPWQIGIRHPRHRGQMLTLAALQRGALATSGDYERCIVHNGRRFGHILHPATGWPVPGLCSVSVIADDCLLAGLLCTITLLKGEAGPDWLARLGVAHVWMDEHGACGQSHWPGSSRAPRAEAA